MFCNSPSPSNLPDGGTELNPGKKGVGAIESLANCLTKSAIWFLSEAWVSGLMQLNFKLGFDKNEFA
jgi:hypothetical protein